MEIEGGQDDDDDSSAEMASQDESYGSEGGSGESPDPEDEEGSELPVEEEKPGKKGRKRTTGFEGLSTKKTKFGSRYASYEDFAHLLDEGLDEET